MPLAESFYNVENGSSFITSKSLSENLSNHKKHLCFCCLQDKTWIKMPKWTIFLISSKVFVLITEIFWWTFWCNNWRCRKTLLMLPLLLHWLKRSESRSLKSIKSKPKWSNSSAKMKHKLFWTISFQNPKAGQEKILINSPH